MMKLIILITLASCCLTAPLHNSFDGDLRKNEIAQDLRVYGGKRELEPLSRNLLNNIFQRPFKTEIVLSSGQPVYVIQQGPFPLLTKPFLNRLPWTLLTEAPSDDPNSSTDPPPSIADESTSSTDPPTLPTETPISPIDDPVSSTDPPISSTKILVSSADDPPSSTDLSTLPTEDPTTPIEDPMPSTDDPISATEIPTTSTDDP